MIQCKKVIILLITLSFINPSLSLSFNHQLSTPIIGELIVSRSIVMKDPSEFPDEHLKFLAKQYVKRDDEANQLSERCAILKEIFKHKPPSEQLSLIA